MPFLLYQADVSIKNRSVDQEVIRDLLSNVYSFKCSSITNMDVYIQKMKIITASSPALSRTLIPDTCRCMRFGNISLAESVLYTALLHVTCRTAKRAVYGMKRSGLIQRPLCFLLFFRMSTEMKFLWKSGQNFQKDFMKKTALDVSSNICCLRQKNGLYSV